MTPHPTNLHNINYLTVTVIGVVEIKQNIGGGDMMDSRGYGWTFKNMDSVLNYFDLVMYPVSELVPYLISHFLIN